MQLTRAGVTPAAAAEVAAIFAQAEGDLAGAIQAAAREVVSMEPRGQPADAEALRMALAVLHAANEDYESALDAGLPLVERLDQAEPDALTARFLHALGRTYAIVGATDQALTHVTRALQLSRELGDAITEGSAYLTLSLIASRMDKMDGSPFGDVIAQALAMPAFANLPPGLRSDLLHDAAENALTSGDVAEARATMERALALKRDSWNLSTYAKIVGAGGEPGRERELLEEARAALAPHDSQARFIVLSRLGQFLLDHGEEVAGIATLHETLAIQGIDQTQLDDVLGALAERAAARGDFREAYGHEARRRELLIERGRRQAALRSRALDAELRGEVARREQSGQRERERLMREAGAQQERLLSVISELSTPLLPITAGVIILPIVGQLDSQRVQQMVTAVLGGVERRRARSLVLDITGVPLVDTQVAAALLSLARSVGLLGCRCVLVGIRPEIAQTLVGLGVSLGELTTRATIAEGLAACGVRVDARA